MSTFSARALDRDGEVQASLVVAQLERRRPHAFAHSRRVAALAVRVGRARAAARVPRSARSTGARSCTTSASSTFPSRSSSTPGPLATIERKTVDLHPAIGSRWLATTPGLVVARAVRPLAPRTLRRQGLSRRSRRARGAAHGRARRGVRLLGRDHRAAPVPHDRARSTTPSRRCRSGAGRQWSRVLVDWLLETVADAECEGQAQAG